MLTSTGQTLRSFRRSSPSMFSFRVEMMQRKRYKPRGTEEDEPIAPWYRCSCHRLNFLSPHLRWLPSLANGDYLSVENVCPGHPSLRWIHLRCRAFPECLQSSVATFERPCCLAPKERIWESAVTHTSIAYDSAPLGGLLDYRKAVYRCSKG